MYVHEKAGGAHKPGRGTSSLVSLVAVSFAALMAFGGPIAVGDGDAHAAKTRQKKSSSKSKSKTKKKPRGKSKKKRRGKSKKKRRAPTPVDPTLRLAEGPDAIPHGDELGNHGPEGAPDLALLKGVDVVDVDLAPNPDALIAAADAELRAEGVALTEKEPEPEPEPEVTPKPKKKKRTCVKHVIIPRENLRSIAERYSTTKQALIRWNKKKLKNGKVPLKIGRTLKVCVYDPPPQKEKVEYTIRKGDSWSKIAKRHDVDMKLLRKWNYKRKLIAGKTIRLWVEPKVEDLDESVETVAGAKVDGDALGRDLAKISVRGSGVSVGKPNRGYLIGGVPVPKKKGLLYCRRPENCYGSTHTIKQLMIAATRFKHTSGYDRPLAVGAVSKRKGGRFRPHRSHQSGRDIDIRLPVRKSVKTNEPRSTGDIDWNASWKLVHAFLKTGEVQYIFLSYHLQKRLWKAARRAGVSKAELSRWIQWPRKPKTNNGVVRHSEGHNTHIHVRVKCGPKDRKCGGR